MASAVIEEEDHKAFRGSRHSRQSVQPCQAATLKAAHYEEGSKADRADKLPRPGQARRIRAENAMSAIIAAVNRASQAATMPSISPEEKGGPEDEDLPMLEPAKAVGHTMAEMVGAVADALQASVPPGAAVGEGDGTTEPTPLAGNLFAALVQEFTGGNKTSPRTNHPPTLRSYILDDFPIEAAPLAGTTITKAWLVRNNGDKPWPMGTTLRCVAGMDASSTATPVAVPPLQPGDATTVSTPINLPTISGHHTFVYRLFDDCGGRFGERFPCDVTIQAGQVASGDQGDEDAFYQATVEVQGQQRAPSMAPSAPVEDEYVMVSPLDHDDEDDEDGVVSSTVGEGGGGDDHESAGEDKPLLCAKPTVLPPPVPLEGAPKEAPAEEKGEVHPSTAALLAPSTPYAVQMATLRSMGFADDEASLTALRVSGGNVNAAVLALLV